MTSPPQGGPARLAQAFTHHRATHGPGWGLAWFLASELVTRFGPVVGLRALPLHREFMGWYGIRLDVWSARDGLHHSIGRLSGSGDVERWNDGFRTRYETLELSEHAKKGVPAMQLVRAAVAHLGLLDREGSPQDRPVARAHPLVLEVLARLALAHPPEAFGVYPPEGYGHDRDPELPVLRLEHGEAFVAAYPDGSLIGMDRRIELVGEHLAGASAEELAGDVAQLLGLHRTPGAGEASDYSLGEHRHRFACWAAARAASRKLAGGSNRAMRIALEDSALPGVLLGPPQRWPQSAAEYDRAHSRWCGDVVSSLHGQGVETATYGRAAKLVAVYVKAMIVCGGEAESALGQVAHPPIDRLLLQALARQSCFPSQLRQEWRRTSWTTLDVDGYDEVILSLREAGLDYQGFWRAERWWSGDGDR